MIQFLQGNCIDKIKELKDNSIDCVVTSPPYWGLRDYGTAQWENGDINCDHIDPQQNRGKNSAKQSTNNKGQGTSTWKICKKCGAKRIDKQLGLEPTYQEHIQNIVALFRVIKPKLKDSATVWLNYGDSYAGTVNGTKAKDIKNDDRGFVDKPFSTIQGVLKPKDLLMIPNRVAIALQDAGWYIRSEIIWHKPNPMPESVTDRPTNAHEKIWLITKNKKYYYDSESIKEKAKQNRWGGKKPININNSKDKSNQFKGLTRERDMMPEKRNKRNVWTVTTKPFRGAHFATFPKDLIEPCIKAGCPENGIVLDPFGGAGTTGIVAKSLNRQSILIELNPEYIKIAKKREEKEFGLFNI